MSRHVVVLHPGLDAASDTGCSFTDHVDDGALLHFAPSPLTPTRDRERPIESRETLPGFLMGRSGTHSAPVSISPSINHSGEGSANSSPTLRESESFRWFEFSELPLFTQFRSARFRHSSSKAQTRLKTETECLAKQKRARGKRALGKKLFRL
jgi:hypothetical protein